MNKKHFIILLAAIITAYVQCNAQPSKVKTAAKSVFKLTTYKADGSILAESNCIFTDSEGTAISTLTPFIGAAKATITDTRGHQMEVTRMLGANELYNFAKFKTEANKIKPIQIASEPSKPGDAVWIASYGNDKGNPTASTIKSVETFMDKYSYYILNTNASETEPNTCILINESGKAIGLTKPAKATAGMHAIDANYALSLSTSGFSLNDPVLSQIGIPPALPEKQDQALLMLMIAGQKTDTAQLEAIASDYIKNYPTLIDGYTSLARFYVSRNEFSQAANIMEEAIKQTVQKDDAHAAYGKLIYDVIAYSDSVIYSPWTLEMATSQTEKAYEINPLPIYRHQLAQINYAKGKYQEAHDEFLALLKSPIRNPELFYEAARCIKMQNGSQTEIIALLDSAINTTDTLRINEAAPYFLERAEAYEQIGNYRQAVFDYTRYEILSPTRPEAYFYYTRALAEIKARLYQQALADISTSITLAPNEPTYYAEMASLQLRVNLIDDAIRTATRCIEIAQDYSDGYLILGLAQISKGDKTNGILNLNKADKLGNTQAKQFIDKYSTENNN